MQVNDDGISMYFLRINVFTSEFPRRPGESAYSDIEVVQELRAMLRDLKHEAKVAPSATDTSAKWLSWPDYLGLVSKLKAECAGRNWSGKSRNDQQVALSLQRYLIFAIMSCIPDR